MRDTKKRPVATQPVTVTEAPKTIPKPPKTDEITNKLKDAEKSMGDLIEVCSFCYKHGCHACPSIWIRADDPRYAGRL